MTGNGCIGGCKLSGGLLATKGVISFNIWLCPDYLGENLYGLSIEGC